jgi:hypothetical protein
MDSVIMTLTWRAERKWRHKERKQRKEGKKNMNGWIQRQTDRQR